MGQVYLGESGEGALVAVKVVHPGLAHDDRFRDRFRREVEVSSQVTGPWVAAVVDADLDAEHPWLATQYVAGPTLLRAVSESGPLVPERVRALGHGLALALGAIHGRGLVHRDLKPSNVLLDGDRPRLIDFGISRAIDGTRMTSTGMVIGTPAFMSPEQISDAEVGSASDVFSLGSVLYFAATGQGPFGEATPVVLLLRISRDEPALGAVPETLRHPIEACLAKNPDDRPTAAALATLLGSVTSDGAVSAPVTAATPTAGSDGTTVLALPAHPEPRAPAPPRRLTRRAWLGMTGVVGLAAAGGLALTLGNGLPASESPPASSGPPSSPPVVDTFEMSEPGRWRAILRGTPAPRVAEATADAEMVYVYSHPVGVVGLDAATGEQLWAVPQLAGTARSPTESTSIVASLDLADGILVAGTGTAVAAIDARTGALLWQLPRAMTEERRLPLAVTGGTILTVHNDRGLVALDLRTGTSSWSIPTNQTYVASVPVAARNEVFFLGYTDGIYAIDRQTGTRLWSYKGGDCAFVDVGAAGDLIVAGFFDEVVGLDAKTGQPRWSAPGRFVRGRVATSVGLTGDVLVVLDNRDTGPVSVRALDLGDGSERWSASDAAWVARTQLTCTDGIAYVVPPDGPVVALDAATGARRWTGRPEREGIEWVTAHGRDVYVNCWGTGFQAITVP
jgi:outer membrane protein assembly factor BamB